MAIETVGVIAALAVNEASRNRALRRAEEAWSAYAKARNMTFEAPHGWLSREWPRVEGERGDHRVAIEVATHITQLDRSTAFLALPSAPANGWVELTREGIAATVAKLFGAQDLELGDKDFDHAFVVKATTQDLARRLFPASIRRLLLDVDADRVLYQPREGAEQKACVAVERIGIVTSPEELDRYLDVATEIASQFS